MAAGGVDGVVLIGDARTGQVELTLPAHGDMIWGLAFSPDGQRLASTSWDKTTKVWDLETGEEIAAYADHTDMVFGVVFSPDGQRVYTASVSSQFFGESLAVVGLLTEPRWLGQETGHSHPGLLRGYPPATATPASSTQPRAKSCVVSTAMGWTSTASTSALTASYWRRGGQTAAWRCGTWRRGRR